MVDVVELLGAGMLVVVGVVLAGSWHAYRTLPEVYPRSTAPLGPVGYEGVRIGLVGGGAVGALGTVVALVDTAGTVAATAPAEGGVLREAAVAIPEWFASTAPASGAVVVAASGLVLLGAELADRADR